MEAITKLGNRRFVTNEQSPSVRFPSGPDAKSSLPIMQSRLNEELQATVVFVGMASSRTFVQHAEQQFLQALGRFIGHGDDILTLDRNSDRREALVRHD